MNKRKAEWLSSVSTDVLENVLNTLSGPELHEQSDEYPLGGLVHMSGVGQIRVSAIERELNSRKVQL